MSDVAARATDAARRLSASLGYPLTTGGRLLFAVSVAAVTYVFLVLSTFPQMSVQMLAAGPEWLDEAVVLLTRNTYATVGVSGLGLVVLYAALTGVAVTNTVAQFRASGGGLGTVGGLLPGLVASGCASCGAGVLGLLGFAGALAVMPFHGDFLRVGGIALLLFVLVRTGDPRVCDVG